MTSFGPLTGQDLAPPLSDDSRTATAVAATDPVDPRVDDEWQASGNLRAVADAEIRLRRALARALVEGDSAEEIARLRSALAEVSADLEKVLSERAEARLRAERAADGQGDEALPAATGSPAKVDGDPNAGDVAERESADAPTDAAESEGLEVAAAPVGEAADDATAGEAGTGSRLLVVAVAIALLVLLRAGVLRRIDGDLIMLGSSGANVEGDSRRADCQRWLHRAVTAATAIAVLLVVLAAAGAPITAVVVAGIAVVGGCTLRRSAREVGVGLRDLARDAYRVGEFVRIGQRAGRVERIDLWATTLRLSDDLLCVLPRGEIGVVENESRGHPLAVVEVPVAHDADVALVETEMLAAVCDVADEDRTAPAVAGKARFTGVDRIADGGVVCRLTVPAAPGRADELRREVLLCAVDRLRDAGVLLAVPTRRMLHHIERPSEDSES